MGNTWWSAIIIVAIGVQSFFKLMQCNRDHLSLLGQAWARLRKRDRAKQAVENEKEREVWLSKWWKADIAHNEENRGRQMTKRNKSQKETGE